MFEKYNFDANVLGLTAVIALILNFALIVQINISHNEYEHDLNGLAKKINELYTENEKMEKELRYYHVNKKYLMSIGATDNQADLVLKASTVHNIDPKF